MKWFGQSDRGLNDTTTPLADLPFLIASQAFGDPHIAARAEEWLNRRVERVLRWRGWRTKSIGYIGYGNRSFMRILGRVVFTSVSSPTTPPRFTLKQDSDRVEVGRRGWRIFFTAPAIRATVTVRFKGREIKTRVDRSGYLDLEIRDHGLEPGWQQVTIQAEDGSATVIPVHILADDVPFGMISDIDDTVIVTHLPRMLIAAWNTLVKSESARDVVPGMAQLYRRLGREYGTLPVIYLSTGAWNAAPLLVRFMKRHDYPVGPLLMTDWGPTNTGWFRSGSVHKRRSLQRLAWEFPDTRWILVGDDGQHDPKLYDEFSRLNPDSVELIAIRQLSPTEQFLSHGLPLSNDEMLGRRRPVLRGSDGFSLWSIIKSAKAQIRQEQRL